MKRYLLFCGDNYYPGGGWEDFVGSYDDMCDAVDAVTAKNWDWYQIIDAINGTGFCAIKNSFAPGGIESHSFEAKT